MPVLVTIRSDEPENAIGLGDGDTTGDVNGQDGFSTPVDITGALTVNTDLGAWVATIWLRAERDGVVFQNSADALCRLTIIGIE